MAGPNDIVRLERASLSSGSACCPSYCQAIHVCRISRTSISLQGMSREEKVRAHHKATSTIQSQTWPLQGPLSHVQAALVDYYVIRHFVRCSKRSFVALRVLRHVTHTAPQNSHVGIASSCELIRADTVLEVQYVLLPPAKRQELTLMPRNSCSHFDVCRYGSCSAPIVHDQPLRCRADNKSAKMVAKPKWTYAAQIQYRT